MGYSDQKRKHRKAGISLNGVLSYVVSHRQRLISRNIFDAYGVFDESLPACELRSWPNLCL